MAKALSKEEKRLANDATFMKNGTRLMAHVFNYIIDTVDRKLYPEEIRCAMDNVETYIDYAMVIGIVMSKQLLTEYDKNRFEFIYKRELNEKILSLYKAVQNKFYRDNFTKPHNPNQILSVVKQMNKEK